MCLPACLGVLLTATLLAVAQPATRPQIEAGRDDKTGKGSIRGRVVLPGGSFISESLKATLLTVNGPQSTVYTDSQGSFDFPDLIPGNYEVQIETNDRQFDIVSQSVQVFRGAPSIVTITLRDKTTTAQRTASRSVSVGELGAEVPRAAKKEFELASRAAEARKTDEAIAHLRKAITIYPKFVMARNDLGTLLLAQGKLDDAHEELSQAIQIDPKAFNPKLNLGIVLAQEHNFAEAAAILDQALILNSESPSARLYAGLTQMALGHLDNAEKQLKAAYTIGGSSYALALFHLGQLYMNKGEREQSLHAFEGYLRDSPSAANADQVKKLIAVLR